MDTEIGRIIVYGFIGLLIVIALRPVITWYYGTKEIAKELKKSNDILKQIHDEMVYLNNESKEKHTKVEEEKGG